MYLGRYQQGDRLPLRVFCSDADDAPVEPDEAPRATIWSTASICASNIWIPPIHRTASPGLFQYPLHLDSRFPAEYYTAEISWKVNGAPRATIVHFEVVGGGHPDGAVISMYAFSRPQAEFLVFQTDAAKIFKGRNPSV
jgi:hypothetical protein